MTPEELNRLKALCDAERTIVGNEWSFETRSLVKALIAEMSDVTVVLDRWPLAIGETATARRRMSDETDPWQSLERVKHDLREAKALFEIYKPLGGDLKKIYTLVSRALDRVDW